MELCGELDREANKCARTLGHTGKHKKAAARLDGHLCHWPTCDVPVDPKFWGCKKHWFKLPEHLRKRIWATYKPGQEITKTPSNGYLLAAQQVQVWIKSQLQV